MNYLEFGGHRFYPIGEAEHADFPDTVYQIDDWLLCECERCDATCLALFTGLLILNRHGSLRCPGANPKRLKRESS
jgi:hypothetical protein